MAILDEVSRHSQHASDLDPGLAAKTTAAPPSTPPSSKSEARRLSLRSSALANDRLSFSDGRSVKKLRRAHADAPEATAVINTGHE